MDYSKMSNQELLNLYRGTPRVPDYSKMSDQELLNAQNGGTDSASSVFDSQDMGPKTIQEQHPDITIWDRLVTKNLATNPESMVKYLARQHPNLQIEADTAGQIKIKRPEETDFKVLDPDTGISGGVGELVKDIGDAGYDIASGIGSGVATAAGGLAGGLPGAVGAGAVSSGGLEALRQGAGSALGVENNLDTGQILGATGAGAVSPLLFGSGASLANAAGEGWSGRLAKALGKELPEAGSEAAKALALSQRGLPARGASSIINKFAPKIGGMLSGVPAQNVADLAEHIDVVPKFEADSQALVDFVKESSQKDLKLIDKASSEKYHELGNLIKEKVGDNKIDVSASPQKMFDYIKKLEAEHAISPSGDLEEEIAAAHKAFTDVWGEPKIKFVDGEASLIRDAYKIDPAQLQRKTKSLQEVANFGDRFPYGTEKPKTSDMVEQLGSDAYASLKKSVHDAAEGAKKLQEELAKIMKDKEDIYKTFSSKKMLQNAQNFSSNKVEAKAWAQRAKAYDKIYKTNLDKTRGVVAATAAFNKNAPLAINKHIPASLAGGILGAIIARKSGESPGMGGAIGGTLGGLIGGPQALRAIIQMSKRSGGGYVAPATVKAMTGTWNMMSRKQGQEGR